MNLTILSQNQLKITVGWTPPAGATGYVFSVDGKRVSSSFDPTKNQVTFGIPDDQAHTFTVEPLGKLDSGSVTVNQPTAPPAVSTFPNALGPLAAGAPDWSDGSKWRTDSASLLSTVKANASNAVLAVAGYGVAYFKAAESDPQVTVKNTNGWGTATGTTTFRCPTKAVPAAGTDAHLVVEQSDGTLVEMWKAARQPDGSWTAGAVCKAAVGQYTYPVAGCRGSSLTLMSGVVTPSEVKAGVIAHALAATLPAAAVSKSHVAPSNSSDGTLATGIPEGARICLDPSLDVNGLDWVTRAHAKALQTHGMIVVDKTGSGLEIDAVDPLSWTAIGQPDPWKAQGISGYPSLNGLLPLLAEMRIAV